MIVKLPADVQTGESLWSYKVFRSKNNKMDEEEFEMMYYFLSLRRKPKINCAKKRRFWVRSILQKRKRLGEYIWFWLYDYLDTLQSHYSEERLFFQNRFSHVESYYITNCCLFHIFFLVFSNILRKTHLCMKRHESLLQPLF